MEHKIEVFADTHEPGSLETMLWFLEENHVYSTGDHIPSGMKGPEREMVDNLRAEGVKDVSSALAQRYEVDLEFRAKVDAHYQKTIANMQMRREALKIWARWHSIHSCAGNQDFAVSSKMKERYNAQTVFEAFTFHYTRMLFFEEPDMWGERETGVILIPYTPNLKKATFEEARKKLAEKEFFEEDVEGRKRFLKHEEGDVKHIKRFLLLSHQSIDCTGMGLSEEARDAYTDPGNRALITHYYEFVRELVGPENVQMVHGHHHTPYMQYEFRGSKVHNLDIGDLLLVNPKTGETEVKHVFQRF